MLDMQYHVFTSEYSVVMSAAAQDRDVGLQHVMPGRPYSSNDT
jgi:hypothetical protein